MWKLIFFIILIFNTTDSFSSVLFNKVFIDDYETGLETDIMGIGDSLSFILFSNETMSISNNIDNSGVKGTIGNVRVSINWYNQGVNGDQTPAVIARLTAALNTFRTANVNRIVHLKIGVNDLGNGRSKEDTVANIQSIMTSIKSFDSNIAIYVGLIIPAAYDESITDVPAFNSQLTTMVNTFALTNTKVYLIDYYAKIVSNPNWKTEYMSWPATHPLDAGYIAMAGAFKDALISHNAFQ